MERLAASLAWTAVLALSLGIGCSQDRDKPLGGGGGGGNGSITGPGSASSTSTSGPVSVASSGAGGAGAVPFVCDPPAEPGSIYERSAESLDVEQIDPVSMCKYRGGVMLVVNVAAV